MCASLILSYLIAKEERSNLLFLGYLSQVVEFDRQW